MSTPKTEAEILMGETVEKPVPTPPTPASTLVPPKKHMFKDMVMKTEKNTIGMLDGLGHIGVAFVKFLFVIWLCVLMICMINYALNDLWFSTSDALVMCKGYVWGDAYSKVDVIKKIKHLEYLKSVVDGILKDGKYKTQTGQVVVTNFSDSSALNNAILLEKEFEETMYQLNDINIRDEELEMVLNAVNSDFAHEFNKQMTLYKNKILDALMVKNNETKKTSDMDLMSKFTVEPFVEPKPGMIHNTTEDINYAMAASGVTSEDIKNQYEYLNNSDNRAAFSSVLAKTDLSDIGDGAGSRDFVKTWGLRQNSGFVSNYSGPGFGVQGPSEEGVTDPSKIRKISFNL